jgi:hypothetical protein
MQRSSALETSALFALGATATLVAALVGTVLAMIIFFPMSLLAIVIFPVLLGSILLAAILAAPVTLILLPLTYQLMRKHPIIAQLAIPAVGFVAGGGIVFGWIAAGVLPSQSGSREVFSAIGMISGLSGGGFFVRGMYA